MKNRKRPYKTISMLLLMFLLFACKIPTTDDITSSDPTISETGSSVTLMVPTISSRLLESFESSADTQIDKISKKTSSATDTTSAITISRSSFSSRSILLVTAVDAWVYDASGNEVSSYSATSVNSDGYYEISMTGIPYGSGYYAKVNVYNSSNSTTVPVVTGTSELFSVGTGETTVDFYLTPYSPTALTEGVPATVILESSVPYGRTLSSLGGEAWFSFTPTQEEIVICSTPDSGSAAYMVLCDSSGATLDSYYDNYYSYDGVYGYPNAAYYTATVGETYYLGVISLADSDDDHPVSVTYRNVEDDDFEDNDTRATARAIETGDELDLNFNPAGDFDWFSFPAQAGTTYLIETSPYGIDTDTVLYLYDSSGTEVASNDDYNYYDDYSRIGYTATANETLYILVFEAGNNDSGEYTLSLSESDLTDSYEDNDTMSEAYAISPGDELILSFFPTEDEDWFSFSAVSGVTYTITTSAYGLGSDTILYLYDSEGNYLEYNDDTDGYYSQITYTAEADGTLYIMVVEYDDNMGEYTLSLTD